MSDQNITELPVKTSSGITSSDYMLGIDSAEGYQMLIRDLGDYIIRNVQVNTIAGSNQTLKNALDTLNSKASINHIASGKIGTVLDVVSDYTDPVHYYTSVKIYSGGTQGLFGTSGFATIGRFTSRNYGWVLCLSDNASHPLKILVVNVDTVYIHTFTSTSETVTRT